MNIAHWLHEVGVLAPNHQAGQLPWLIDQLVDSVWPVAYSNQLFDITHILRAQRRDKNYNALYGIAASLCKAIDWQYEREWRLVVPYDYRKIKGVNVAAPPESRPSWGQNLGS